MKNSNFLLLLSILTLNSYTQTINNLDEKNGYKDFKFGALKSELNDKIFDCSAEDHCLVKGDSYRKIRNVTIEDVFLKFTGGKLFAIILAINGQENVDGLLNIYKETYGKATTSDIKDEFVITWEGKDVILLYAIKVDDIGNVTATAIISAKNLLHKNSQLEIQKNKDDL